MSVAAHLSEQVQRNQENARKALEIIISSIMFLARQGLAFRGHGHDAGNFFELVKLRSADVPQVVSWLERRDKWMSDTIQNELIEMVAHCVQRRLIADVKVAGYFSIMCDGTTDVDGREQFSFNVRFVPSDLIPREYFVGMYQCPDSKAETLSKVIFDVLTRLGLPVGSLRGHCFDGASNMSGCINGVQKLINQKQPSSTYVHCCNHALDLALQEAAREVKLIRDTLQTARDGANIIRESSKRQAIFESLALDVGSDNDMHGNSRLQTMCPTRWCVRSTAIRAFTRNYEVTLATFDRLSNDKSIRSDSRSKIEGVLKSLAKMETYLGLLISLAIFQPCEELAKSLQSKSMSLSSATTAAGLLRATLISIRCDEQFAAVYNQAEIATERLDLKAPKAESENRRHRPPARYEHTSTPAAPAEFSTYHDRIRVQYYEAIDILTAAIDERFNQPGMKQLLCIEQLLLLSAADKLDDKLLQNVLKIYGKDFEKDGTRLKAQLVMLPQLIRDSKVEVDDDTRKKATTTLHGLVTYLTFVPLASLDLFGEVVKLIKLLLVCPASVATAERSFSDPKDMATCVHFSTTSNSSGDVACTSRLC